MKPVVLWTHNQLSVNHLVNETVLRDGLQLGFGPDFSGPFDCGAHAQPYSGFRQESNQRLRPPLVEPLALRAVAPRSAARMSFVGSFEPRMPMNANGSGFRAPPSGRSSHERPAE